MPESAGLTAHIVLDGREIPAILKILDKNKHPVYIMAYLEDDFNFVYDEQMDGARGAAATAFVYSRKEPSKSFVFRRPENFEWQCYASEDECNQMKSLLEKYLDKFKTEPNFNIPVFGGYTLVVKEEHLKNAQSWENFLLKKYKPMKVIEKELAKEMFKQTSLNLPQKINIDIIRK